MKRPRSLPPRTEASHAGDAYVLFVLCSFNATIASVRLSSSLFGRRCLLSASLRLPCRLGPRSELLRYSEYEQPIPKLAVEGLVTARLVVVPDFVDKGAGRTEIRREPSNGLLRSLVLVVAQFPEYLLVNVLRGSSVEPQANLTGSLVEEQQGIFQALRLAVDERHGCPCRPDLAIARNANLGFARTSPHDGQSREINRFESHCVFSFLVSSVVATVGR